jgi:hypothetical protein
MPKFLFHARSGTPQGAMQAQAASLAAAAVTTISIFQRGSARAA